MLGADGCSARELGVLHELCADVACLCERLCFVVVILPVLGLLVVPYSEEHMPCMVVDISRIF